MAAGSYHLRHRGRRVGGLRTGWPVVGSILRARLRCWRRAGRTGSGRSAYRWLSPLLRTGYDWNYRTSRQPELLDRELYWPRGKTLGGSSSINGQAWTRGHRLDYDGWAESCPGWSYEEVVPYFQRAERRVGSNAGGVYGTSGPQFVSELRDPNPTTFGVPGRVC